MLVNRKRVLFKRKLFSCLFLLLFLPSFIFSQGVVFTAEPNWQAVLNKARSENKYVFVDVFATWCGPCKSMAAKTFADVSVGNYVNERFIAVKLQMDTTTADKESVKAWYADAKAIGKQYKIKAFPTILFFNPEGKLVHKTLGFKSPKELKDIAQEATDPSKQLYTRLEQYTTGKLDIAAYPELSKKFKEVGENKIAEEIAAKYIANLSGKNIYTKENLAFIREFTTSTEDKMFNVFFKNQKKVDEIMETPYYSQDFVDYLISKDYVDDPYLIPASNTKNVTDIDWNKMYKPIEKKFGAIYADRRITDAKARWYGFKQQWPEFVINKIKYNEVYDRPELRKRDEWYYNGLNDDAWAIFEHSNDPQQLKVALKWSKLASEKVPNNGINLDTYANLLYKLGRKEEAIAYEEKAVSMDPNNKDLKEALEKMKAGLPTWPQQ